MEAFAFVASVKYQAWWCQTLISLVRFWRRRIKHAEAIALSQSSEWNWNRNTTPVEWVALDDVMSCDFHEFAYFVMRKFQFSEFGKFQSKQVCPLIIVVLDLYWVLKCKVEGSVTWISTEVWSLVLVVRWWLWVSVLRKSTGFSMLKEFYFSKINI